MRRGIRCSSGVGGQGRRVEVHIRAEPVQNTRISWSPDEIDLVSVDIESLIYPMSVETFGQKVVDGEIERKSGSIILTGRNGKEIERYNFFEAWPVRYKNYTLDSMGRGVLVEEIEIAVERIERG